MKREIKFRAWKTAEQEWFKPIYEAYDGKLHDISITINGNVMERTLQSNASMLNEENYILQQFTGLTDKNGVDIYEGDVIKFQRTEAKEIIFSEGAFGYIYENEFIALHETYIPLIEIIGNIYENPELL